MTFVGRLLGALIAIAALTTATLAQDAIDQRLARALVIEETKGDSAEAAAIYKELREAKEASAEQRLQAGLGLARCQRRAGDIEKARALLGTLAKAAKGNDKALKAIAAERARLDGVNSQDQDALRKKILTALDTLKTEKIVDMGSVAIEPLLSILKEKSGTRFSLALTTLTKINDPVVPETVATLVAAASEERAEQFSQHIRSLNLQSKPGYWDPVIAAGSQSPLATVRHAAARQAKNLSTDAPEVWERLLTDEATRVRSSANYHYLTSWSRATNEEYFRAFRRALDDPSVEIRRLLDDCLRPAMARSYDDTVAIIEDLVVDPDPKTRTDALNVAGSILPKSRTKPLFMAALKDPASNHRILALSYLSGRLDTTDVIVVRTLLRDPEQHVRDRAASTLSRLPAAAVCDNREAEKFLLECLQEQKGDVRSFAASILARAGSLNISEEMTALFRAQNFRCRYAAAYYMVRMNRVEMLPAFLEVIAEINGNAIIWDQLPYRSNTSRPHPDVGRGSLQKTVFDWVRRRGHREAVPLLLERAVDFDPSRVSDLASVCRTLANDDKENVFRRIIAINDLTWRNGLLSYLIDFFASAPYALEYYEAELSARSLEVRQTSSSALYSHGSGALVPALIKAIESETTEGVADQLALAVVRHALPKHVSLIESALKRGSAPAIQNTLVRTLGKLGTKEAFDILVARLDDADSPRAAVLRYLGNNRVERARPIIRQKLVNEEFLHSDDRKAALRALGKMGEEKDVPVLIDAMRKHADLIQDNSSTYALETLAANATKRRARSSFPAGLLAIFDMGGEIYLNQLPGILANKDLASHHTKAVQLLAFIDDNRADDLIINALGHDSAEVRISAAKTAGHALLTEAKSRLRRLLRDESPKVRQAANSALLRFVEFGVN